MSELGDRARRPRGRRRSSARRGTRRARRAPRRSAAATRSGGSASGSPVAGSTSGRTQTGSSPERTSPASTDLCVLRETIDLSPGRPSASASAWLPCVEPFPQKRQRSAPQSVGGEALGLPEDVGAHVQVVGARGEREVETEEAVGEVRRALVPRRREGRDARRPGRRRPRRPEVSARWSTERRFYPIHRPRARRPTLGLCVTRSLPRLSAWSRAAARRRRARGAGARGRARRRRRSLGG